MSPELKKLSILKETMNPNISYLFSEFRGRFPVEITYEARSILQRWYPTEAQALVGGRAQEDVAALSDIITGRTRIAPDGEPLSALLQMLRHREGAASRHLMLMEPGGYFEMMDFWTWFVRLLPVDSQEPKFPSEIGAVKEWATDMASLAVRVTSPEHDPLPSSICAGHLLGSL